jgi:hypothetical protein
MNLQPSPRHPERSAAKSKGVWLECAPVLRLQPALRACALRLRSALRSGRATGDKLPTVIPSAATAQPWRSRGIRKIASHENMKSWVNRAFRHPWPRCHGAIWFDFAPLRSAALTMTVSPPKQCCPRAKLRALNDGGGIGV